MDKLVLLALLVGNCAIGIVQLTQTGFFSWDQLLFPLGYTGAYILCLAYLRWREQNRLADSVLLASICALTGIGLAAIARIDGVLAWRQLSWLYIGLFLFALLTHSAVWKVVTKYTYLWALLGIGLLVWPMLYGLEVRGARSWVAFGPLSFQPAEFAKICFVFALSSYLAKSKSLMAVGSGRRRKNDLAWMFIGPVVIMVVVFGGLLTLQRDLGAALLLSGLGVGLVAIAMSSLRYLIGGIVGLIMAAVAAVSVFDHVRTRFELWLDPWSFLDGRGYQIVESLFALGAGGVFGTGWARGMADRIPIVESDFIYSLIVEEIGLLGGVGVLFLVAVVSLRMMAIGVDSRRDEAERLGAVGFGLLLAFQSFLIVAGVTRLMPITGMTLPFVSYGGSSLLVSCMIAGMAYNLYVVGHEPVPEKIGVSDEGVVQWSRG